MEAHTFAVIMTCHNRREVTLDCLDRLIGQAGLSHFDPKIFLVDDGCTDGTGSAVKDRYPCAVILEGQGDLFWCGGMRLAFSEALKHYFDYYLWLNDDSMLFPDALRIMLETVHSLNSEHGAEAIVVGSMCDPETGGWTYGGLKAKSFWRPMTFLPVMAVDTPIQCDVANGNFVLLPRGVARAMGTLSEEFCHGMGDFDYILRASRAGFQAWAAPGFVGTCSRNSRVGSCRDRSLPVEARMRKMKSPAGMPPPDEWMRFVRRHAGPSWPILWLRTLLRKMFPRLWVLLRSKDYLS